MKICADVFNRTQIYDPWGSTCLCSWAHSFIGRLTENTFEELWNGERAQNFFKRLAKQDYSLCDAHNCPYLASEDKEVPLVEIDEFPKMPTRLMLAYEQICNYRCTVCAEWRHDFFNVHNEKFESLIKIIEKNLKPVLPKIKNISANGRAELFASKHILKLLANWKPLAPKEECSVVLETNGSLFNKKNWKQIENLGQYNLHVAITVMSFDERTYQTLSGCRLPIKKLEDNLRFVKSLREKSIINHLEIATVIQERNFRTLPEFTKRCIKEFGADSVRLRPYIPVDQSPPEFKFFADIKNVNHPYHEEYVQVLQDPIFKNPKADNWGTLNENYKWDLPYKVELNNRANLQKIENQVLTKLIINPSALDDLINFLKNNLQSIILHSAKPIGLLIAKKLIESNCKINYITDFELTGSFNGVSILPLNQVPPTARNAKILLAEVQVNPNTLRQFRNMGYSGDFIGIQSLLENK